MTTVEQDIFVRENFAKVSSILLQKQFTRFDFDRHTCSKIVSCLISTWRLLLTNCPTAHTNQRLVLQEGQENLRGERECSVHAWG